MNFWAKNFKQNGQKNSLADLEMNLFARRAAAEAEFVSRD